MGYSDQAPTTIKLEVATTVIPPPNGTDDTAVIQAALNRKGHILIDKPGTYIVSRLEIDDNTLFELGDGVTLKKKDGTNTNILTNKGYLADPQTRNKNIHIKGGIWDLNSTGNPSPATGLDLIGVLLKGVDGLKITDVVEIGDELKYCYLIVDATNIICQNINFNNASDGLHFQPPINNLLVENITGMTEDDMVAFTMGDYTPYALGITGDIENVIVRNICSSAGTAEHIKLVGSGTDGLSVFRNMRFENISGPASVYSVCIMNQDQAVANDYLLNTKLENISFSYINPTMPGPQTPYFYIGAASGDVLIENITFKQQNTLRMVLIKAETASTGTLDMITFRNIKCIDAAAINLNYVIRVESSMTVRQLNFVDCRFDFSLITGGIVIYQTNNSILETNIINCWLSTGTTPGVGTLYVADGTNATPAVLRILNSVIVAGKLLEASTPMVAYINNSSIHATAQLAYMAAGGNVRVNSNGSAYTRDIYTNTPAVDKIISLKALDGGYNQLLSTLTPVTGDYVRSTNATDGAGLWYYNGTAWEKLTT